MHPPELLQQPLSQYGALCLAASSKQSREGEVKGWWWEVFYLFTSVPLNLCKAELNKGSVTV